MAHRLLLLAGAATALIAPPTRQSPRAAALQAKKTVFIDGEAGTTGLQVLDRLATHPDIEVLSIDPAKRKDAAARKEAIAKADAVVLCLPDDAAREAVALAEGTDTKIVDASTAHRIDDAWVYGFPELDAAQRGEDSVFHESGEPGLLRDGFHCRHEAARRRRSLETGGATGLLRRVGLFWGRQAIDGRV